MRAPIRLVDEVYLILDDNDAVINYTGRDSQGVPRFFMTLPYSYDAKNYAQIMVQLDLSESEEFSDNEAVVNSLQSQLDTVIVGAKCKVNSLEYAYPSKAKVEVMLQGDDIEMLKQTADDVQDALEQMDSTSNVRIDITDEKMNM